MRTPILELDRLAERVDDLAAFVHAFADQFEEPAFDRTERCFRYSNPGLAHFCILRSARVVSALYASICLAKGGFSQEINVLMRSVLEFCSQIDFVLLNLKDNKDPTSAALKFIDDYFADDWNTRALSARPTNLKQKDVHQSLGRRLDEFIEEASKPTAELMSKSYMAFSNYVHGRHVESMDLYGGTPGRFHLFGMSGTKKDDETIEILEALITTANNCFIGTVQSLQLRNVLSSDSTVSEWYRKSIK
ncbi:hypothetical protein AB7813_03705 [Tardiphaga sp. 20_F10_N6_6]|uniref:hypothetical protein n=1 Tax=Tardiphaga sp. 20_F10_N6_6 TaxID=3240788 RepID=UPI003F8B23E4